MKNNQSGQSTIEFIFSFIFAVSLILLVFNTSLNYASGYVTHYATFMASRVFMTQGSTNSQWNAGERGPGIDKARKAFEAFNLSVFGINATFEINDDQNVGSGEYLMVGAYASFSRKMDLVVQITGQTKLDLISESFLGREPTRGVCASRVCMAITGKDVCSTDSDVTLFDDGC